MSLLDDLITWGAIAGLGFVAWKYKIQPELEQRKKEQGAQQPPKEDKPKPKFIEAVFKVDDNNDRTKKD